MCVLTDSIRTRDVEKGSYIIFNERKNVRRVCVPEKMHARSNTSAIADDDCTFWNPTYRKYATDIIHLP